MRKNGHIVQIATLVLGIVFTTFLPLLIDWAIDIFYLIFYLVYLPGSIVDMVRSCSWSIYDIISFFLTSHENLRPLTLWQRVGIPSPNLNIEIMADCLPSQAPTTYVLLQRLQIVRCLGRFLSCISCFSPEGNWNCEKKLKVIRSIVVIIFSYTDFHWNRQNEKMNDKQQLAVKGPEHIWAQKGICWKLYGYIFRQYLRK